MHKTVVIICDGQFPKSEYPRYLIRTADFVICCDGALRKFMRNSEAIFGEKRLPDLVIGDMDTLPQAMQKKYADIIADGSAIGKIVKIEGKEYTVAAVYKNHRNDILSSRTSGLKEGNALLLFYHS